MGGVQGLLSGKPTAGADGTASQSAGTQSAGEASADAATTARVTGAVQQGAGFFGPVGIGLAAGIGVITKVGSVGNSVFADLTNQEGVGHNSYQPDYQAGRSDSAGRANREANATDDQPSDPAPTPPPDSGPSGAAVYENPPTGSSGGGSGQAVAARAGTGGAAGGGASAGTAEVAAAAL